SRPYGGVRVGIRPGLIQVCDGRILIAFSHPEIHRNSSTCHTVIAPPFSHLINSSVTASCQSTGFNDLVFYRKLEAIRVRNRIGVATDQPSWAAIFLPRRANVQDHASSVPSPFDALLLESRSTTQFHAHQRGQFSCSSPLRI